MSVCVVVVVLTLTFSCPEVGLDVSLLGGVALVESMGLSALAELSRGSKELEISDCRGGDRRIIFWSTLVLCGAFA